MKTIKQWFNELPEPYKTQTLNNTDKGLEEESALDLLDALSSAFIWDNSPEGYDYWNDFFIKL